MNDLAKRLDSLSEKLNRYLSIADSSPTNSLFVAGVRSSIETMARTVHKNNDEMERIVLVLNEMNAVINEMYMAVRLIRNRFYCLAGEEAQIVAAHELEKVVRHEDADKKDTGKKS